MGSSLSKEEGTGRSLHTKAASAGPEERSHHCCKQGTEGKWAGAPPDRMEEQQAKEKHSDFQTEPSPAAQTQTLKLIYIPLC